MDTDTYSNKHGRSNPNWRGGYESSCTKCGTTVWVKPSRQDKKTRFCSKPCHHQWMKENNKKPNSGVKKSCNQCGKSFRVSKASSDRGEGKYCSHACYFLAKSASKIRHSLTCECCKRNFEVEQYRASARFCSQKCKINSQKIEKTPDDIAKIRLDRRMSTSMWGCLKGNKNNQPWEALVNYTIDDLVAHLVGTLPDGVSLSDVVDGKWHIDHIIPRSVFNYSSPDDYDFRRCWALENLQLLPAKENLSKGAKLTEPFQPSLL